MHILISNDDGIFAEGINTLADELSDIAMITIVAPDRNCSGASHSLTLEDPLRIREVAANRFSLQGTPTDCVHLALNTFAKNVDLIVSGINHGANLGDDVLYSGTVAAATEGYFLGVPSIAVSLCGKTHFATAAKVIKEIIFNLKNNPLPKHRVININVPDCEYGQLKGWKVTRLGARHRAEGIIQAKDPREQIIYWIGPPRNMQDAGEGTDFCAIEQGFVSLTPLQIDLTAYDTLEKLNQWVAIKAQNEG